MAADVRPLKTVKQIAHALAVSEATVRRMKRRGVLPVTKAGCGGRTSPYIISRADLDAVSTRKKR